MNGKKSFLKKIRKSYLHTICRWLDIIALSCVSYFFYIYITNTGIVKDQLFYLSSVINLLPYPLIVWLLLFLCGLFLPIFLVKNHSYNTKNTLTNDIIHPPTYAAAYIVAFFSLYNHKPLVEMIDLINAFFFFLGSLICCFILRTKNKKANKLINNNDNKPFDIIDWIENDTPIDRKSYDLNNLNPYIKRITHLLKEQNKSSQIVIRGDFGSGKSSLCRLIEAELSTQAQHIFCYVDGWGREESSCAGQILEIIIEKLSEHIDCLSISTTPHQYTNALNSSGLTGLSSIGNLITNQEKANPKSYLNNIEKLLTCIGKKLVLVLEDFDRGPEPEKTIDELAALLERTKGLNEISFILLIKKSHSQVVDKICTHIEDIAEINNQTIKNILRLFFEEIDKHNTKSNIITLDNINNIAILDDAYPLIKTPRNLKLILRKTLSIWKNIPGEVNFFDLIHLNILRFSTPGAFSIVLNNIKYLKNLNRDLTKEREKLSSLSPTGLDAAIVRTNINAPSRIIGELHQLKYSDIEFNGIMTIIYALFPKDPLNLSDLVKGQIGILIQEINRQIEPSLENQRIGYEGQTNYLSRILSESISPFEEMSDQKMLINIKNYKPILNKDENHINYYYKKIAHISRIKKSGVAFIDKNVMRKFILLEFKSSKIKEYYINRNTDTSDINSKEIFNLLIDTISDINNKEFYEELFKEIVFDHIGVASLLAYEVGNENIPKIFCDLIIKESILEPSLKNISMEKDIDLFDRIFHLYETSNSEHLNEIHSKIFHLEDYLIDKYIFQLINLVSKRTKIKENKEIEIKRHFISEKTIKKIYNLDSEKINIIMNDKFLKKGFEIIQLVASGATLTVIE